MSSTLWSVVVCSVMALFHSMLSVFFFFNDTATTEIYTLSLHDALPISGDGGFMYSVNELATAVKYRLPVVFLVMNDDRYGAIKWLQQTLFEGRWGETDLANPDFPALARAFGARGERVSGVDALGPAIKTALAAESATVLELRMAIDPPWELS